MRKERKGGMREEGEERREEREKGGEGEGRRGRREKGGRDGK